MTFTLNYIDLEMTLIIEKALEGYKHVAKLCDSFFIYFTLP